MVKIFEILSIRLLSDKSSHEEPFVFAFYKISK